MNIFAGRIVSSTALLHSQYKALFRFYSFKITDRTRDEKGKREHEQGGEHDEFEGKSEQRYNRAQMHRFPLTCSRNSCT